ncbi:MAG TPA: triose-phosphate isomerase [Fimbriimonadaceae bacterium]|nr:triose-phosphate isomerase [Fimbriimonadaceae bacterium]
MRTKLVAGNWKMNLTPTEAAAAVEAFIKLVDARENVDVILCPSYVSLPKVRELIRNTHVKLGAQDVFWEESGAFTGRVSASMLGDLGVSHCIVGHSESRGRFGKMETDASLAPYFAETDHTVNLKIRRLLFHAINPILCVGETLAERETGKTEEVIAGQLRGGLDGIDPAELYFLVVAYEPVWAIGTGQTCAAPEADRVCGFIRDTIAGMMGTDVAEHTRILYGGSVKAANSAELFQQPNIDGGLVGGASIDPGEFSRIVFSA